MRKINLLVVLIAICCFSQCKKNDEIVVDLTSPLNVTLYDKTPNVIQAYIKGKWKYAYGKWGSPNCRICIDTCSGCALEFSGNNSVKSFYYSDIKINTTINWVYYKRSSLDNDYVYLMTFKDNTGFPYSFIMDSIKNDTLLFHTSALDGMRYYYIK
jgi:hypothetical protein